MPTYTLYADLYFLINFCLDFILFFITGKILRRKLKLYRTLIASVLGAAYAVFCALLPTNAPYYIPIAILAMMAMCLIAFGYHSLGKYLFACSMFVGSSFLCGGIMQALYNLFMRSIVGGGVVSRLFLSVSDRFSLKWLIILALVAAGALLLFGRFGEKAKIQRSVKVEVSFLGKSASFDSLVDTGNMLVEPISSRPVIIIDESIAASLLPGAEGIFDFLRLSSLSQEVARRIRIIPLTSIGGEGVITALLCDSIKVGGVEKSGCIGIYTGKRDFSGFHSIAPASLV